MIRTPLLLYNGGASGVTLRGCATRCDFGFDWNESSMSSSSTSESNEPYVGEGGKTKGKVGMVIGGAGLRLRLLRMANSGVVGDAEGVLRRTKEEMGVVAVKSPPERVSMSGRLLAMRSAYVVCRRGAVSDDESDDDRKGDDCMRCGGGQEINERLMNATMVITHSDGTITRLLVGRRGR